MTILGYIGDIGIGGRRYGGYVEFERGQEKVNVISLDQSNE